MCKRAKQRQKIRETTKNGSIRVSAQTKSLSLKATRHFLSTTHLTTVNWSASKKFSTGLGWVDSEKWNSTRWILAKVQCFSHILNFSVHLVDVIICWNVSYQVMVENKPKYTGWFPVKVPLRLNWKGWTPLIVSFTGIFIGTYGIFTWLLRDS